jgi:hypothetical protein
MARIMLIHWKAEELPERVARLESAGYQVETPHPQGAAFLRELAENPPATLVIDLTRLPSHGRDYGILLRQRKGTRRIPLVFVGGAPDKVDRLKGLLPDAVYTAWEDIGTAVGAAIAGPPADPVVPASVFEAYKDKQLVEKLGIKPGFQVALYHPPEGFKQVLGKLPKGVVLLEGGGGDRDLSLWFARSVEELEQDISAMAERAGSKPMWIAWPKKSSKLATDLTQQIVREAGLASGLVDYKICTIDATWSGLLFKKR